MQMLCQKWGRWRLCTAYDQYQISTDEASSPTDQAQRPLTKSFKVCYYDICMMYRGPGPLHDFGLENADANAHR